jgi:hypothetical protein
LPGSLRAWATTVTRIAREAPVTALAFALACVLFGGLVVAQLASLSLPLLVFEGHHWRQSFTYGVAWNFAHATMDVLRPRMFVELGQSNVVPMEAPLYPLLASVSLRLGDGTIGPRLLSWSGLVATVFVSWRWLADPRGGAEALPERAGLLVALGLAPMVAVDFRSIQPEPFAAGLAILSAFFFARYGESSRAGDAAKGAVCFGLSLLSKPLALGVAPALLLLASGASRGWTRRGIVAAAALAIASVPWAAYDRWAHHLLATALHGDWVIEIEHPPRKMFESLVRGEYTSEVLLNHLPHYATSWWLAPATVLGVYRGLAEPRWRRLAIPMLAWLAGYMVELLAVGVRLHSNAYYFILAAAPLAWFAALGLGALVRLLGAERARVGTPVLCAGLACLVLLPIGWACSRASSWANASLFEAAALGFERNRGVWTSPLGLARLVAVLVSIFAVGPRLRARRVPRWIGVGVLAVMAGLAVRPARDRDQFFRAYVGASRRPGFDEELRALRAAVDRYSGRADRIVVSPGGTYREPHMIAFFYALRNGFARDRVSARELRELERRGARLYLQIDQAASASKPPPDGRLLATGRWWRLSCVASDGCN